MEYVKISNDPVLGFVRKAQIRMFEWNLENLTLNLYLRIHFFEEDETTEIFNSRIQPYNVLLEGSNQTIVETSPPMGEYDYYYNLYFSNPLVLFDVFTDVILARDEQGRFN